MSTMITPPIDLYAETDTDQEKVEVTTEPRDNGDRDDDAVVAGERRLEQVLGW